MNTRTLTYPSKVDPPVGTVMGPTLGTELYWVVLGAIHTTDDQGRDITHVELESFDPGTQEPPAELARRAREASGNGD